MSFYFDLGKAASSQFEKNAGGFASIGQGLGHGADFLAKGLKPLGKLIGKGLGAGGLTSLGTAGGLGLAGMGANELLAATGERTGLNIPHLFNSKERPLWSPQQTPTLINPKQQGWSAFGHMATRPIQTLQSLLGYAPKPIPEHISRNFDPTTGKMIFSPEELRTPGFSINEGKMTLPSKMQAPVFQDRLRRLNQELEWAKGLGVPQTAANKPFDPDQPRKLTLDDLPFNY